MVLVHDIHESDASSTRDVMNYVANLRQCSRSEIVHGTASASFRAEGSLQAARRRTHFKCKLFVAENSHCVVIGLKPNAD